MLDVNKAGMESLVKASMPTPEPPLPESTTIPESELTFEEWALKFSPLRGRSYSDFSDFEQATVKQSFACATSEAMVSLLRSVQHVVHKGIPGAFVKCGVWTGGNIELMIRTLQKLGVTDRDIYAYDTFAGMPRPDAIDDDNTTGGAVTHAWETHRTQADGEAGSDWMRITLEWVRNRIECLNYPSERLHFVKGMVEDTIPATIPGKIAILRLDTDFYASTKHELKHLYPRLSPGGILIIDDYGAMPGSRIATDEYLREQNIPLFLNRVDAHVRLAVKPPRRYGLRLR